MYSVGAYAPNDVKQQRANSPPKYAHDEIINSMLIKCNWKMCNYWIFGHLKNCKVEIIKNLSYNNWIVSKIKSLIRRNWDQLVKRKDLIW